MDVWSLFYSPNLGTYNMKIQRHDLSANLGREALVARPRSARRSSQMRSSLGRDAFVARSKCANNQYCGGGRQHGRKVFGKDYKKKHRPEDGSVLNIFLFMRDSAI